MRLFGLAPLGSIVVGRGVDKGAAPAGAVNRPGGAASAGLSSTSSSASDSHCGFDLLWSSSPLVFSSPAPSSDQPELNANDSLEQQSASSPPSSNGNFPDDEAAEHDSDPAGSPSEAEEESTGDEADLDDTPSTDGDDDGGSLLSFGGDWPSSTPDIPSSLSSVKFSTTSSQASHGGDGREEQHQAFYNPDGAWGSDAGSDQDEASSASEDDELPNTEGECLLPASEPGSFADYGRRRAPGGGTGRRTVEVRVVRTGVTDNGRRTWGGDARG
ncbi:hypothetical protein V8E36_001639 [Tilletia maclaganii]